MPFREKAREIRKKFSRGSSSTSGTSSEVSGSLGDELVRHTTHSVYKPGERIPYKYRRPVEKAHKEKLEAFTFASAWNDRRKSFASQYSPMGSRLPSRRSSMEFYNEGRSMGLRRSDTGDLTDGSYGESPAANTDLSHSPSTDGFFSSSETSGFLTPGDFAQPRPRSRHERQFTPEDLTLALQRSRLEIPP